MKLWKSAFMSSLFLLSTIQLIAQPKPTFEVREIVTPENTPFMRAQFSPSGKQLLFTSLNHSGLFTYSFETKSVEQLNNDPSIGFGATWIDDQSILVRHTIKENVLSKHAVAVLSTNGELNLKTAYIHSMPSVPFMSSDLSTVFYVDKSTLSSAQSGFSSKTSSSTMVDFYPISNRLVKINPTKNVSTVQSVLQFEGDLINLTRSIDGKRIAFEVMGGDVHVFDVESAQVYNLGKLNRPSFSPDGNYIVAMLSQDDGYEVTSSELISVRFDGSERQELTSSFSLRAMNPSWSPSGNQIVFDSPDTGAIYILSFTN